MKFKFIIFLIAYSFLYSNTTFSQHSYYSVQELDSIKHVSFEEALLNPDDAIKILIKGKKHSVSELDFTQFKNLQALIIKRNNLTEIPKNITETTSLQVLDLDNNKINKIPEQITQLNQLKALRLGQNEISEIPYYIYKLEELEILDLWSNNITRIPDEISSMKNLKLLDLRMIEFSQDSQNKIHEKLPWIEIKFSYSCNCSN